MKAELIVKSQDSCIINGFVTRNYVESIMRAGDEFIKNSANPSIDCSGVTEADSSTVALMLHWWKLASKQDKQVCFKSLSKEILAIAKVCNLSHVFNQTN